MAGGDGEDTQMSEKQEVASVRRMELLAKLVARAKECPGLYPFCEEEDFLRVAVDHGGQGEEGICFVLESVWRRPDEAVQLNAQSLIRRGLGFQAPTESILGVEGAKKQAD